jgi:S1-C subfamily serine protease
VCPKLASAEKKPKVKQDTVSSGTGQPVPDEFVVTNYHVVKGHKEFLLLHKDEQKIPAAIAAYDATEGTVSFRIALLHIGSGGGLYLSLTSAIAQLTSCARQGMITLR